MLALGLELRVSQSAEMYASIAHDSRRFEIWSRSRLVELPAGRPERVWTI